MQTIRVEKNIHFFIFKKNRDTTKFPKKILPYTSPTIEK